MSPPGSGNEWAFLALFLPTAVIATYLWVYFPVSGPGGTYPIDADGRLLPKTNWPRFKGLTHHKH